MIPHKMFLIICFSLLSSVAFAQEFSSGKGGGGGNFKLDVATRLWEEGRFVEKLDQHLFRSTKVREALLNDNFEIIIVPAEVPFKDENGKVLDNQVLDAYAIPPKLYIKERFDLSRSVNVIHELLRLMGLNDDGHRISLGLLELDLPESYKNIIKEILPKGFIKGSDIFTKTKNAILADWSGVESAAASLSLARTLSFPQGVLSLQESQDPNYQANRQVGWGHTLKLSFLNVDRINFHQLGRYFTHMGNFMLAQMNFANSRELRESIHRAVIHPKIGSNEKEILENIFMKQFVYSIDFKKNDAKTIALELIGMGKKYLSKKDKFVIISEQVRNTLSTSLKKSFVPTLDFNIEALLRVKTTYPFWSPRRPANRDPYHAIVLITPLGDVPSDVLRSAMLFAGLARGIHVNRPTLEERMAGKRFYGKSGLLFKGPCYDATNLILPFKGKEVLKPVIDATVAFMRKAIDQCRGISNFQKFTQEELFGLEVEYKGISM